MGRYDIFATHADDTTGMPLWRRFAQQNKYGVARRDPEEVRKAFERMQALFVGTAAGRTAAESDK